MPDPATLRARVLAGETVFGTFLNLNSPLSAEICARSGLDWVLVDLEHGTATESDLVAHLTAMKGTPAAPLVRVEQGTRLRIGRALDLGADGVVVPQVHSVDEAQEIVSWLRFPPGGKRGIALFTRGLDFGSGGHAGVDTRNKQILGVIQVESQAAIDAAADIAAIDGVDVLFVGPTDLSHALGVRGQIDHPIFQDAIERVAQAARSAGKAAGVLVWRPEDAHTYAKRGYTFFALSGDAQLLDRAIRSGLADLRSSVEAASA
jgi:2-keto-3-deoxy-L-rhamnonate aldolase RhmA